MPTTFQLLLEDTSPVVSYFPFAETLGVSNLEAGWNSYFNESGFLTQLGQTGQGSSFHVTSLDGASFEIKWFGIGISLFGISQAGYGVSMDGATPTMGIPDGNKLAEFQDLEAKEHTVALIAHPDPLHGTDGSFIAFDYAILDVSTESTNATISSQFVGITDPEWFFSGNWTELSDPILDGAPSQSYRITTKQGDTAEFSFQGSAIRVTGLRNATHGHYNVTLDGTTTTFDGHSDWSEVSTLFLEAGLDERTRHSMVITNVDDASLAIAGVDITHATGGTLLPSNNKPSASALPAGTIVALILIAIVALLAIGSLLVCIHVRRHRLRDSKFAHGRVHPNPFLDNLNAPWTPTRARRYSRAKEVFFPAIPVAAPSSAGRSVADNVRESPVVMSPPIIHQHIDPSSPLPYSRLPNSARRSVSFQLTNKGGDRPPRGGQREDRARESASYQSERTVKPPRLSNVEISRDSTAIVMQDLLDAYTSRDSDVLGPFSDHNSPTHRPTSGRRRSQTKVSMPRRTLQVEIPNSKVNSRSSTSVLAGPLTPAGSHRGTRRASRRSSFGGNPPLTAVTETPVSISTIRFGARGRESLDSSFTPVGEELPANSPSITQHSAANDFLGRLKAYRAARAARAVSPTKTPPIPGESNWKPPW